MGLQIVCFKDGPASIGGAFWRCSTAPPQLKYLYLFAYCLRTFLKRCLNVFPFRMSHGGAIQRAAKCGRSRGGPRVLLMNFRAAAAATGASHPHGTLGNAPFPVSSGMSTTFAPLLPIFLHVTVGRLAHLSCHEAMDDLK